MSDILSYINEYKNKTFCKMPLNEVDLSILCQVSYSNLHLYQNALPKYIGDIKSSELNYLTKNVWDPSKNKKLLKILSKSKRFSKIDIINIEKIDDFETFEQFYAITLRVENKIIIVFRGTDTTINGWTESLSISFENVIPAQQSAQNYLSTIGKFFSGEIIICGHSKGGNLAVFAASMVDKIIQDKISYVLDLDGPGFFNSFFNNKNYNSIEDKIVKIIPKQSIFGLMLESVGKVKIVESNGIFLEQHLLFNWKINKVKFKYTENVDKISKNQGSH